jgi:hypothetical protein
MGEELSQIGQTKATAPMQFSQLSSNSNHRGALVLLLLATFLAVKLPAADPAAKPPVMPSRVVPRTNPAPGSVRAPGLAQPDPAVPTKTNTVAGAPKTVARTNAPTGGSSLSQTFRNLRANSAFYPAVGVIACLLALVLFRVFKSRSAPADKALPGVPSRLVVKGKKAGAIHSCNVLEVGGGSRQIWQFDARGGRYVLGREQTSAQGEALPGRLVAKDWRSLFQAKLNVAWLPPDQVFLRVAQLPRSDFNETLAMVELQLEKLSPMPVAQTVWSFHVLQHTDGNLQTVIVMIVARSVVEEFLGKLEGQGFLADRLELPIIDQLQATAADEDGAWIYPDTSGKNTALVAWWCGAALQNLDLLTLPAAGPERAAVLKEQLLQMAWAGEMEGWLTSPPQWHLVAGAAASEWETPLREGLEQPVEIVAPLPERELAALTARRAAAAEPQANLLPAEFATRYRQQFVDRLWMRGLMAVGGIYLAAVLVYMSFLGYANWRNSQVEGQVAALSQEYTNTIQLRDRFKVLKERQDLKYAALDCWNATASLLPEDVTLESMDFRDGKRFTLNGTAPSEAYKKMLDFYSALRKYKVGGELLFDPSKDEPVAWRGQGPTASTASWRLDLELKRSETQ